MNTDKTKAGRDIQDAIRLLGLGHDLVSSPSNPLGPSSIELLDTATNILTSLQPQVAASTDPMSQTLALQVNAALARAKGALDTVYQFGFGTPNTVAGNIFEATEKWFTNPTENLGLIKNAANDALNAVKDATGATAGFLSDLLKAILGPFKWVLILVAAILVGYIVFVTVTKKAVVA